MQRFRYLDSGPSILRKCFRYDRAERTGRQKLTRVRIIRFQVFSTHRHVSLNYAPTHLDFGKLERGCYGDILQNMFQVFLRERTPDISEVKSLLKFGALCAPQAHLDSAPELLHVGHVSLLSHHFGRNWAIDPAKWQSDRDEQLDRAAAFGYDAPLNGEPSICELAIVHSSSRFGPYFSRYHRAAIPIKTKKIRLIFQVSIQVEAVPFQECHLPDYADPLIGCRPSSPLH